MSNKNKVDRVCERCGRLESEHCVFKPVAGPKGCICDPEEWGDQINPICDDYNPNMDGCEHYDPALDAMGGNGELGRCMNCEHDARCHGIDFDEYMKARS